MTLLFLTTPALAATVVSSTGLGLDEAIANAEAGDTLLVSDGEWSSVIVDKDLSIEAVGSEIRIDGIYAVDGAQVSVFGCVIGSVRATDDATLSLDSVIFESDPAAPAPAVEAIGGTVFLTQVDIGDWPVTAVIAHDAILRAEGVAFVDVHGESGGAIHAVDSEITVRGSLFRDTGSQGFGGAIFAEGGSLTVESSVFADSRAHSGGHVAVFGGTADFSHITMDQGRASDAGGSIYSVSSDLTLSDASIENSFALSGGAIAIQAGSLWSSDLSVFAGRADLGAGLWIEGGATVELVRSRFSGGVADKGGAVAVQQSTLIARNGVWSDTEWANVGGALFVNGGFVDLSYLLLAGNQAEVGAGLAVERGNVSLDGCIVYGNASEGLANANGLVQIESSIAFGNLGGELVGEFEGWSVDMATDPLFVDPDRKDWALSTWSPGIDAGPDGAADLDATAADMGPYGGPDAWNLPDVDGDGWVYGRDCDDHNSRVFPYAVDTWYDGVDSDCRGNDDFDADGDGWNALQDCDDTDPAVNPGAIEASGDALDADCDGLDDVDDDGDRWTAVVDCDDHDASIYPGADDPWYDGIDSDCRGNDDFDADGDGYDRARDCDDADPLISPDGAEIADDGIDQDCDGVDARTPDPSTDYPLVSTELRDVPPNPVAVRTGCSSSGSSPHFLAAFLALIGLLLPLAERYGTHPGLASLRARGSGEPRTPS